MKAKCGLIVFFCIILCGCPTMVTSQDEVILQKNNEWTDFRRSDLLDSLAHFNGKESESEAINVLGSPDKVEIIGLVKNLYWVAASRRGGGSPREDIAPTFQVSYLIVKMRISPTQNTCEIDLLEYIGHDPSPDPFLAEPVLSETEQCINFKNRQK